MRKKMNKNSNLLLDDFIEFAKKEYGYDILLDEKAERDTLEKIFKVDFQDKNRE